jgi:acyl-CoA synthetase (AMP-forming)/AMP-acid ligase II
MAELQVDQIRIMARLYPDEIGYQDVDSSTTITFAEWDQRSNQLARGLAARGIAQGDRVALYLSNDWFLDWIVAYAAIHKAGAVAVPVNTRLTARELVTILDHAGVRAAITCADMIEGPMTEAITRVGSLELVASIDGVDGRDGAIVDLATVFDDDAADFQVSLEPGDLADIMYTSGTTGTPKGVAVRHRNASLLPNGEVPWTANSWLQSSPPFTFAGISFVYNPMKLGLAGMYQAKFDAGRWLTFVEELRPTCTFIVPAMAQLLVNHDRWEAAELDSLTLVSVGSAPLPPDTLIRLCERFPNATVTNGYGMTEAGPAYCAMNRAEVLKRIGSVGKPMPPMEVRITDPASGDDVALGEPGEVLVRAKGRQREYYRDTEATERAWTPEGWLHSGDIGRLDADGYLYIVGRMKEVIIRGGNNVHATDVESVLYEHPGVLEAAVVGVAHDVLGEDIAAFVVPTEGTVLTVDDLDQHCRARLADYKCPRRFTFLDALPRNPTGKVLKGDLVESI